MIKWLMRLNQKHGFLSVFVLAFILMAWDIGNLDALRQGTEGFYLQISKEMDAASSFLTPLFRGEPHWSKPPLHFWLPFPLYSLGFLETTTAARLSILFLSLISIAYIAIWVERFFSIPKITAALFLLSTIGFAKYSRIFMMEMPLSLISSVGALLLFASIYENKKRDWIGATIFCALSVLVKGPVSWVMLGGTFSIFLAIRFYFKKDIPYKKLLLLSFSTLALGSLWFIACYIKYGQYFIDYFFLRENLGKFTSKPYPIRFVFQGLLVFSLPWSFYLPLLFNRENWKKRLNINENKFWPRVFIICAFFVFFFLWLVPNQRSHHYAMPSIFFFLIILLDTLKCHHSPIRGFSASLSNWGSAFLFFLLLPILLMTFAFPSLFENTFNIFVMLIAIAFTLFAFISFFRKASLRTRALSSLLCFGYLWSFVTPLFVFPTVPDRVIKKVADRDLTVVYRKPYFIEEALDRNGLIILNPQQVAFQLSNIKDLLLIPERVVKEQNIYSKVIVVEKWRVWQKSRKISHILDALSQSDLSLLQESLLLVEIKR